MKQRIRQALAHRERRLHDGAGLVPAAVLIPIYEKDGQYHILFTERTQNVEHHKGEISFPGGAYDAGDGDLLTTALREAGEEIGISPPEIEILGMLDTQPTLSNFIIHPYVGVVQSPCRFNVCRSEVAGLIEAPLSELIEPRCLQEEAPGEFRGAKQARYSYHVQGRVIWGATARILHQFLAVAFYGERGRTIG